MSKYSFFNITNHATFKNLEFTGIDMLAASTGYDLSYMPLKLCDFTETPTSIV